MSGPCLWWSHHLKWNGLLSACEEATQFQNTLGSSKHTVDERNPAPVDRWFTLLFIGFLWLPTIQGGPGFLPSSAACDLGLSPITNTLEVPVESWNISFTIYQDLHIHTYVYHYTYHIISYHIISYHVMSCHVISISYQCHINVISMSYQCHVISPLIAKHQRNSPRPIASSCRWHNARLAWSAERSACPGSNGETMGKVDLMLPGRQGKTMENHWKERWWKMGLEPNETNWSKIGDFEMTWAVKKLGSGQPNTDKGPRVKWPRHNRVPELSHMNGELYNHGCIITIWTVMFSSKRWENIRPSQGCLCDLKCIALDQCRSTVWRVQPTAGKSEEIRKGSPELRILKIEYNGLKSHFPHENCQKLGSHPPFSDPFGSVALPPLPACACSVPPSISNATIAALPSVCKRCDTWNEPKMQQNFRCQIQHMCVCMCNIYIYVL